MGTNFSILGHFLKNTPKINRHLELPRCITNDDLIERIGCSLAQLTQNFKIRDRQTDSIHKQFIHIRRMGIQAHYLIQSRTERL